MLTIFGLRDLVLMAGSSVISAGLVIDSSQLPLLANEKTPGGYQSLVLSLRFKMNKVISLAPCFSITSLR